MRSHHGEAPNQGHIVGDFDQTHVSSKLGPLQHALQLGEQSRRYQELEIPSKPAL